jgi:hypothetical protein
MIRVKVVWAKPMKDRHTAFIKKAIVKGIRVSNLLTSQPLMGSPIKELTGIVRRIEPSSASFRFKAALIVGIREAQLEKLTPERKKNTLRETRCLFN